MRGSEELRTEKPGRAVGGRDEGEVVWRRDLSNEASLRGVLSVSRG